MVLKELSGLTIDQNNAENMEYDETSRNDGLHLKDLYSSLKNGELHIRKVSTNIKEQKINSTIVTSTAKMCLIEGQIS